jgi:hypothetical protein
MHKKNIVRTRLMLFKIQTAFLLLIMVLSSVFSMAEVEFVGRDSTTQGNWRSLTPLNTVTYDIDRDGKYGTFGYLIFNFLDNLYKTSGTIDLI